jgi:DNA-binding transcriptional ArsR family regulator
VSHLLRANDISGDNMADRDFVFAPPTATVQVTIALEPAYNALNSLHLLSHPEERSGFSEWVTKTSAALPPERARLHRMVVLSLFSFESINAPTFPAFLEQLATDDPEALRDRAIEWIGEKEISNLNPPDKATLLSDSSSYLGFIERLYGEKGHEKEITFEPSLFEEAHALLTDPPALQKVLVEHMGWMWENVMRPEWERVLPMLKESVDAFQRLDLSHLTALEAVRLVTGRDVSGIWDMWPNQIIFIPSAHIGPYITRYDVHGQSLCRLIFGARLPEGARAKSPALSRSELLVRLSALADDTRLRILELLTVHEELCAPDIIKMLELSQSAVSRHLRQLTATGYLIERRREVAKCYTLNPQRMEDTLRALKRFLRTK